MSMNSYVLITPVRNEAAHIEKTIISVINQTAKPTKWVIVSDHSIDATDEIVKKYSMVIPYIHFLRNDDPSPNHFGSKVYTFNKGYSHLANDQYDFIGNLDGDVSFEPKYYEQILNRFSSQNTLGIAGGRIVDMIGGKEIPHSSSMNSVAGAIQLFRRSCFESIGGYFPLELGGIDTAAEICARAKGWQVQHFRELKVLHHKPMTTGSKNIFFARIKQGKSNYILGYSALFQFLSCCIHIGENPVFINAIGLWLGYMIAFIRRMKLALPKDVVSYLRKEQMQRIAEIIPKLNQLLYR